MEIRVQILKMLHYLPSVFENSFLSQNLCKDLMQNVEKLELTDQCPSFAKKFNLTDEEYTLDDSKVMDCNSETINKIQIKLQNVSFDYYRQRSAQAGESPDLLGGTLRLNKAKLRDYERLKNIQINVISFGLLSTDFRISSKTSKLL